MSELTIRRNRGPALVQFQQPSKAEKASASAQSQPAARKTVTISETLRELMDRTTQTEGRARESRRTLQTGEAVLAEVQDALDRIGELVQKAADGGSPDRAALQAELEGLRAEIERMVNSAHVGDVPMFLEEDTGAGDETEALLYAVTGELAARQEAVQALPDWLTKAVAGDPWAAEAILAALGLDRNASSAELLAAVMGSPLDSSPAAGHLAALYLGAVIAGADPSGKVGVEEALEGLRQFLELVAGGVQPDQAVSELTDGMFSSLADFQEQFTGGTAPGLQMFLADLLLSGAPAPQMPLLPLLAGAGNVDLDLLMGLLTVLQGPEEGLALEGEGTADAAAGADQAAGAAPAERSGGPVSTLRLGDIQVTGRDLSGLSFDEGAKVLTISGSRDVAIQGRGGLTVVLAGSGAVTLRGVDGPAVTVTSGSAQIFTAGENVLKEVRLEEGASLRLDGSGLVRIAALHARGSGALHLTGGAAVVLEGEDGAAGAQPVPVVVEGAASLAARAVTVTGAGGKALEPFDILWKTLLPGWTGVDSMTLDGRQTKMALLSGDPVRLWLDKGDPSHGYPAHTLIVRGKDELGRLRTRYAYLRWDQRSRSFQEISLYPNPFTVTGGESGEDWVYEEESHTLWILSDQVTEISGGFGMGTDQTVFSGRIALADKIGEMELSLGGVVCRVSAGRAFDLGRENDVKLLLQSGTRNRFESGAGCAGISLGSGTSLSISARQDSREEAGSLTAAGGAGGAGIGRDSGSGRDRSSRIVILGGIVTASGTGGGAGIGAGKYGPIGPITIAGGVITATGGKGGGAGIGGALGAQAGDISIRGGTVSAQAVYHAAAIGAGIQGACGDVHITGTARIVKALGGDPGADIGACLFGSCGQVLISGGADIGSAKLRTQMGISLRMGGEVMTLPQFRLSAKALQLDTMDVMVQEQAQAAGRIVDADRRWVAQIQAVYDALHDRLEQSTGGLSGVCQYIGRAGRPVRDTGAASALLQDMSQSIRLQPAQAMRSHSRRGREDVGRLLR